MFFIGQNLKHVHMTYSFLELLIFFWLTLDIYCLEFISHHTKEKRYANTNFVGKQSWNTNHELVSDIDVEKTKLLMINFNFSQFHENIFRSCHSQIFFKIGALKNCEIQNYELKVTSTQVFCCKKQPRDVNILIEFLLKMPGYWFYVFIFRELVYPFAHASMLYKTLPTVIDETRAV